MRHCVLFALLLCLSCGNPGPSHNAGERIRGGDSPVTAMAADDPELAAATAKAKAGLPSFIGRLAHAKPDERFTVKVPLPTSDGSVEHMWLFEVSYHDAHFTGKLADEPVSIPSHHAGDAMTVPQDDVEDWAIFSSKGTEGSFSTPIIQRREAERNAKGGKP